MDQAAQNGEEVKSVHFHISPETKVRDAPVELSIPSPRHSPGGRSLEPSSKNDQQNLKLLLEVPSNQGSHFGKVQLENDEEPAGKGFGSTLRSSMRRMSKRFSSMRQSMRNNSMRTRKSIEEDAAWMAWIEERVGNRSRDIPLDLEMFKQVLGIEKAYYAQRLFDIFDTRRQGSIVLGDLLNLLSDMTQADPATKLKLIFSIYDADGNGTIDEAEFTAVLSAAIDENALAIAPQQIEYMTKAMFAAVDTNMDGVLTVEELQQGLEKHPGWIGSLQISFSRFLKPPAPKPLNNKKKRDLSRWCPPYFLTSTYIRHNPREFGWSVFYALSIIAFYLYGSLYAYDVQHVISTPHCLKYYVVAHGFGMNLNWNCMLLVVFMLRRTLTYIRGTRIGPYLPIDGAVFAHKVIGYVVGVCILGHWILHMVHFQCLVNDRSPYTYEELLWTTKPGLGWVYPGVVAVTGWPMLFAFFAIFICSLPIIRRSGMFEIFFFSHLLYIPFLLILIVHSDKFWKFIIGPGIIFVLEKISMTRCVRHIVSGEFFIREVVLWESGVTQLTLNHPPGFAYNAGDYIFINIPNIAWFEWHPFTISSCPENADSVTVHVRCLGEWTRRLYKYFKDHEKNCGGTKIDIMNPAALPSLGRLFPGFEHAPSVFQKKRKSVKGQPIHILHVPIYVDGPYGTPSGHIFNSEHAVLVCAGIGVTPFASILQSIMYRHRAYKTICPECAFEWSPHMIVGEREHVKKVTFIWVVNNQRSLEWFVELLESLDVQQIREGELDRLIDIRIYVTSATKMIDLHAFALTTALDIFYEKHNRDLITGIRSRAIPGRPNWKSVFDEIDQTKRGKVSVFFCGPPVLGQELRERSEEHDFDFHKESF